MTHTILTACNTNPLTKALIKAGLLPANCTRYVIDSGLPAGPPMKIYTDAFVDDRFTAEPVIKAIEELGMIPRETKE